MAATKLLIVLVGASVLLVSQQERGFLQNSSVSWAGQAGLKSGEVIRDRLKNGGDGPEMIVIPAGRFRMGDIQGKGGPDERPVREVHMRRPFTVSRYEITFDQYDEFANATKRELPEDDGFGRGRLPVIFVSWDDAVAYAEWLSRQTGKRYRLPTETEWEYAALAGTGTEYWWGNEMKKAFANCTGCGSQWDRKQTAPVGSFKPNPIGLYDTAGNVIEWVQDCWHENYNGAPLDGVRLGNKRMVAIAADVDFAAVTGATLRILCVHPFGCGTARPFGATTSDSVLFGKSNNFSPQFSADTGTH